MKKRKPTVNHLLLIAINNYSNGIPKLFNCVNDANLLFDTLNNKYEFEEKHTYRLFNEKATRKNILNKLKKLNKKVKKKENLVVFFSGHGININGVGHLVPCNAEINEDSTYITQYDIQNRLDHLNCKHILLILDACFSGSFFLNTKSLGSVTTDSTKASRWGISASDSDQVALDGTPFERGPFVKSLTTILNHNNSPIDVHLLSSSLKTMVKEKTKNKQTPIIKPLNVKGDKNGIYTFYQKKKDYTTQRAIYFLNEEKNSTKATDEIINYVKEHDYLPKGYEYHFVTTLAELKIAYIQLEKETTTLEDITPIIQKVKKNIPFLLQLITIDIYEKTQYRFIINLLYQGEILAALDNISMVLPNNINLEKDLSILRIQNNLNDSGFKMGIKSQKEFLSEQQEIISSVAALVWAIEKNKTPYSTEDWNNSAIQFNFTYSFPLLLFKHLVKLNLNAPYDFIFLLDLLIHKSENAKQFSFSFNEFHLQDKFISEILEGLLFLQSKHPIELKWIALDEMKITNAISTLKEIEQLKNAFQIENYFITEKIKPTYSIKKDIQKLKILNGEHNLGIIEIKEYNLHFIKLTNAIIPHILKEKLGAKIINKKISINPQTLDNKKIKTLIGNNNIFPLLHALKKEYKKPHIASKYINDLEKLLFTERNKQHVNKSINKITERIIDTTIQSSNPTMNKLELSLFVNQVKRLIKDGDKNYFQLKELILENIRKYYISEEKKLLLGINMITRGSFYTDDFLKNKAIQTIMEAITNIENQLNQ